jgi:hypothetical protein
MKLTINIFFLALFSLLLCFFSYRFCYFIAEKYFFDKFFYQKSISHGYNPPNRQFNYLDYGNRAKDLMALENPSVKNVLGISDDNYYRIVVIGDSHVWGSGIRNEQRFSKLLENKFNKIKPTKVYSYGKCGNNTLDYYDVYKQISSILTANLYIIVPVTNDAILLTDDLDNPITNLCQKENPNEKPIMNVGDDPGKMIDSSWINPINQCIVNKSLEFLPTNNAIYFIDKNYDNDNSQFKYYLQSLNKNNKYVLSTEVGKYMDKYKKYFDPHNLSDNHNIYDNFSISRVEPHPNALANQMYADILFNEITTNSKWNFHN